MLDNSKIKVIKKLFFKFAGLFIIRTLLKILYFLSKNYKNITPTGHISTAYVYYECLKIDSKGMKDSVPILLVPTIFSHFRIL